MTTDAAGQTTTSTYDARGLSSGTSYSSGLAATVVEHDALGRVTSATDAAGETEYTYDVLNRVTGIAGPTGDVSYAYNAAGNVQSVTYPSGRVVERVYDAAGRLTGVETDGVGTVGVTWTDDGLVDAVSYPNGVATDYSYDLAGRATGIATSGSAGDVLELGYAYSPGSLVTSRSTSRSGGAPVSESVTWDAAARLSTISSMSSGVPVQYTPSHEVTRADDGAVLAWGADGALASRTFGTDVTSYASDLLGRRTSTTTASGDVASFGWDQVGRLTGVGDTASGSLTDYTYAGGLRIGAATTTGGDTTSEAFAWDTLAGVPLLLSDGGYEYIYALGSAPVAQVDTVTGAVVFLHGDLVGSTRAATDASGTVVGTWDYSTFGVTTTATGGAAGDGVGVTRFPFAGEYQDNTGLYYLRARFYDPVTASFLSVDPALAQTGSPYAYTSGNPLQMVDPLGLNPWDSWGNSIKNTVDSLTSWEGVGDYLQRADCQVFGGFFGDVKDTWDASVDATDRWLNETYLPWWEEHGDEVLFVASIALTAVCIAGTLGVGTGVCIVGGLALTVASVADGKEFRGMTDTEAGVTLALGVAGAFGGPMLGRLAPASMPLTAGERAIGDGIFSAPSTFTSAGAQIREWLDND